MGHKGKKANQVIDAERSAEQGPLEAVSQGVGGSVMQGDLLTEGQFLQPPAPTFVVSPYGQRYIATKPRGMSEDDITLRVRMMAFDVKGYLDKGTMNVTEVPGVVAGHTILQDWYGHVRDMGKRTLKYKHTPTSLTDHEMLRWMVNADFYVVANLSTLLNLNRLPQRSLALASFSTWLPGYMSRISRLWRRTSALPMMNLIRLHAIRSGYINFIPSVCSPVIRFWRNDFLLPSVSGGPTLTAMSYLPSEIFQHSDGSRLGVFISNLEAVERWLETGTSTILTDFVAVKDVIDMTHELPETAAAFTTGLPDGSKMPGFVNDPDLLTDVMGGCLLTKDDVAAGTDRWTPFPIAGDSLFGGGRTLVAGFAAAPHPLYDFHSFGRVKYAFFDAGVGTRSADVDSDIRLVGTDFPRPATFDVTPMTAADECFWHTAASAKVDEQMYREGTTTAISQYYAYDLNDATAVRSQSIIDTLATKHPWSDVRFADRDSFTAHVWSRFINENHFNYTFYPDREDFGENYAVLLQKELGVPYIRAR